MGQAMGRLPTRVGDIHLGMALERVLTCLGNVLFDEFPFVGGTTCIRQTLDRSRSPFESVTYCFAEECLFAVIWENASTDPLVASTARFGPPTLSRSRHGADRLGFVEHRWQQEDVEFIVTDFSGRDETHSFAVEMCDARVKRGLASQASTFEGETERR
jgi:hypothetical protein